ncbi:alpha/beta fold hydrolase [Roseitranquillus sediminis]|uniref:alpha/beta fold hydrolase n=1 Tax=Roseitranquillus sediminis TaxID=2809051 RepID=UPI001D0CAE05|nr:alpha/beta hydrolase [Roseitranquillus sediminis]
MSAPFHLSVAEGPAAVEARWLTAADGIRIRGVAWPEGEAGTILLFTGRTEYVEKYGRAAAEFGARGYAVASVDWRGQGLSDRALTDVLTGHVADFADYQHDVDALVGMVREMGLPRPFHLVAHSMGGGIGLRSLHRRIDVASAVFSAPMWGIGMSPFARPLAWLMSWTARGLGHGHRYIPGTSAASYVGDAPFDDNLLTTDREMFDYMQRQTATVPELQLGGPSMSWLLAALNETRSLRRLRPPDVPTLAMIGTDEGIVDPDAVRDLMKRWPRGRLDVVEGARHEIMMERPDTRRRFFETACDHFRRHSTTGSTVGRSNAAQ